MLLRIQYKLLEKGTLTEELLNSLGAEYWDLVMDVGNQVILRRNDPVQIEALIRAEARRQMPPLVSVPIPVPGMVKIK